MEIHVGCSGWFYWHWRGIFYPEGESTRNWFQHYTGVFDTVELNAPFYKWPRPATVKGWKRGAPSGFRYTVKVNGEITHERRMVRTQRLVTRFYEIGDELGPQMGCFLFQFPPSYKYSPARLKSIVRQLDPARRNVVEFRHRSWWRPSVYRALAAGGITFCAVSAPRLPEDLPPAAKGTRKRPARVYVRFHGRTRWYRHDYSTDELTTWARRVVLSKAREVWIYFNNDREGFAIKNALELRHLLRDLAEE
jgi:uncharacterized protein YecE (DUF72 family)